MDDLNQTFDRRGTAAKLTVLHKAVRMVVDTLEESCFVIFSLSFARKK